jgi:hypothetical protein
MRHYSSALDFFSNSELQIMLSFLRKRALKAFSKSAQVCNFHLMRLGELMKDFVLFDEKKTDLQSLKKNGASHQTFNDLIFPLKSTI